MGNAGTVVGRPDRRGSQCGPALIGGFLQRTDGRAIQRVVDEAVQPTQLLRRGEHCSGDLGGHRHVTPDPGSLQALSSKPDSGGFAHLGSSTGQDHRCAVAGHGGGQAQAYAGSAAGDQSHPSVQQPGARW